MSESVFILDDNEDLREMLALVLRQRLGVSCIGYGRLSEIIVDADTALKCRMAILDINLGTGQPSGLEAFDWLQTHKFKGEICFFTGHAKSHPLVAKACQLGARVYEKPMSPEKICALVGGAIL